MGRCKSGQSPGTTQRGETGQKREEPPLFLQEMGRGSTPRSRWPAGTPGSGTGDLLQTSRVGLG